MPSAIYYIPPTDKARWALGGNDEFTERLNHFNLFENYYNGRHDLNLLLDGVGEDYNVVVNLIRQSADRTISFLFPEVPRLELRPDDLDTPDSETPEEIILNKTLALNGGVSLLYSMAYNGLFSGHVFVKFNAPAYVGDYAKIQVIDPRTIIVYWSATDLSRPLWYEQRWKVGKDRYVQDTYYSYTDNAWFTDLYLNKNNKYTLISNSRWDGELCPIVDWQHAPNPNSYYGRSDFSAGSIKTNNAVNAIASDLRKILAHFASPRTVGVGIDADSLHVSEIGGLITIPNENAQIFNLEMKGDLDPALAFLDRLVKLFFNEQRTVMIEGQVKDFQRVTNTGIRAVFLDMIAKNMILQSFYGRGLQKIAKIILLLNNMSIKVPDIVWPDPLPEDASELVNIAAIKRNMGVVSRQTISRYFGNNWALEREHMLEEHALPMFTTNKAETTSVD